MAKKKSSNLFLGGQAPGQINKPGLLKPQFMQVRCHEKNPELVEVVIGNQVITLHYEDGLKISQWLRVRSKEAKRKSGDTSRHWSAVAVLDRIEE